MSNNRILPTSVINNNFTKEELNESLSRFKQNLKSSGIPYLTITNSKVNDDFLFSESLSDLFLQLRDMVKKPVIFISDLTFDDLPVITQNEMKAINPKITSTTIVQIEVSFKADDLFIKAKYQLDTLYKVLLVNS